jgi:hypothetical protein
LKQIEKEQRKSIVASTHYLIHKIDNYTRMKHTSLL